jgi:D-alanyl-lipoteichoic acid acyltransferase DltB (MBOAT superfamily)
VPSQKGKEVILLLASILFYASWSLGFLFHFLFFIIINYYFTKILLKNQSKKVISISVVLNLFNLGVFKYFYFFTNTFASLSGISSFANLDKSMSFKIILPLAISFYTFQMIAYLVDVYRKKITDELSFFDFSLFILFFPQLIAGPIMRYHDFIPELKNIRAKKEYISPGLSFIALGILKKVLIADNLATFIDPIWQNPSSYSWLTLLAVAHGFTWQIYCDFSGYTDIARGCAFLLGFHIPENFRSPFLADSARDIWQRWHITLSTWLRDYIYISLGGSKISETRTSVNQIITFTLGGLWHGANWTYLFWGFYHGVILVIERYFVKWNWKFNSETIFTKIVSIFYAYHVFMIGAVMFRSSSFSDMITVFTKILSLNPNGKSFSISEYQSVIGLCLITLLIQFFQYFEKVPNFIQNRKVSYIVISYLILTYMVCMFSPSGKEFVYFDF